MITGREDDALSWDGDDDPTLVTSPREDAVRSASPAAPEDELPAGWRAVGTGSDGAASADGAGDRGPAEESPVDAAAPAEAEEPAGLGNASLVALGVLGGVYLLFAVGWLVGGLRLQGQYRVLVTDAMYQGALWLAAAAPLIWFGTVLFATRGGRAWARWAWLTAGAVLLVPWPFIMIGAVGA
ncbi:DNA polymerase III subunit gamma/tau [Microbacterium limosum]|uniref:DNA polymerase III subunit gamma/tau n=1 Tax=Microbacterium limosum TaxID=3079935 RepID=A0AAU0MEG5_9MICO|nr:DNA polymerase III subunit gamma/tau [Microbacterium sp. Y20]WOQ68565.1 DNA polymerase III subunit gamma/tau [Microbacterium sp. Y20]